MYYFDAFSVVSISFNGNIMNWFCSVWIFILGLCAI
jgi:hypothetical protein